MVSRQTGLHIPNHFLGFSCIGIIETTRNSLFEGRDDDDGLGQPYAG